MATYNVWNITNNRWTDYRQSPRNPQLLSFEIAQDWLRHLQSSNLFSFEIREVAIDNITSIKIDAVPDTQKSSVMTKPVGVSCKRCRFFNEYAEANQQDGSYVCFSCR